MIAYIPQDQIKQFLNDGASTRLETMKNIYKIGFAKSQDYIKDEQKRAESELTLTKKQLDMKRQQLGDPRVIETQITEKTAELSEAQKVHETSQIDLATTEARSARYPVKIRYLLKLMDELKGSRYRYINYRSITIAPRIEC